MGEATRRVKPVCLTDKVFKSGAPSVTARARHYLRDKVAPGTVFTANDVLRWLDLGPGYRNAVAAFLSASCAKGGVTYVGKTSPERGRRHVMCRLNDTHRLAGGYDKGRPMEVPSEETEPQAALDLPEPLSARAQLEADRQVILTELAAVADRYVAAKMRTTEPDLSLVPMPRLVEEIVRRTK